MIDFSNKKVFITGGSSGIGLETARQLAKRGAHIWIASRRVETLRQAVEEIKTCRKDASQVVASLPLDVSDLQQVTETTAEFSQQHGTPDLLINSAGITYPGNFADLDPGIFRQMMEVNYLGTVNVIKAFVPGMMARRSGRIVNIVSMAGLLGIYGYSAYGASKYAVRGLSDVVRAELKPYGIQVSILCPADTDTPQLVLEDPLKSPITREIGGGKVVSAAYVAACLIRGIGKRQYLIIPGAENKLLHRLSEVLGSATYWVMDMLISAAMRKHKISI